jgi:hypothetical protein
VGANRTLHQALAIKVLTLSLSYREDIAAELAVEVLDFFLETESAAWFAAFDAEVHLFVDELAFAAADVVNVGGLVFRKSPH